MEPSLPSGEPTMDSNDWRTQLPSDLRQKTLNRIFETLKTQLPFSGPEGIKTVKRVATQFEEDIFTLAANQADYLRQTSLRQTTDSSSIPPGGLNNDNSNSCLQNEEPATNVVTCDWRAQLPHDSRRKNIENMMERAKKHVPNAGKERINELMKIAVTFEESSFNIAISQEDYYSRISLKMETGKEQGV